MQVFAKSQIDTLTANAWLLESKQLEEKVCLYLFPLDLVVNLTKIVYLQKKG